MLNTILAYLCNRATFCLYIDIFRLSPCCHDLPGNAQAKPVWLTPNPLTLPAARVAASAVVVTFFSAPSWPHLCFVLSVFAAFVSPKLCVLFYLNAALSLTHGLYLSIVRNWRSRWPRPFTAPAVSLSDATCHLTLCLLRQHLSTIQLRRTEPIPEACFQPGERSC